MNSSGHSYNAWTSTLPLSCKQLQRSRNVKYLHINIIYLHINIITFSFSNRFT